MIIKKSDYFIKKINKRTLNFMHDLANVIVVNFVSY